MERGFVNEARQAQAEANKGVTRLRQGVEKAAESVLGDETEALRRAKSELDALAQELDREIGSRAGRTPATTQPGSAQAAPKAPTARPGAGEQYARADDPPAGGSSAEAR